MSDIEVYVRELAERGYREEDAPRFAAAWEQLEAAYLERLRQVCAPYSGWRDRFRAAAAETARLVEAHLPYARFLIVDAMAAGPLGRQRQRALGRKLAEALDAAREELDDPDSVPASTAPWIVAIFFDRIYRRCADGGDPDLPSQLPELMFLAISAYFGIETGLAELVPPP